MMMRPSPRGVLCFGILFGTTCACGSSDVGTAGAAGGSGGSSSGGSALSGAAPTTGGAAGGGGALSTSAGTPSTGGAASGDGGGGSGGDSDSGSSSGGDAGAATGGGGAFNGTCTASKTETAKASGSGEHDVVVETNADPGINEGTIIRPADLGAGKKYPIFVWGEGGCEKNGLSNLNANAEIASHGYFVIADGTPGGSGNRDLNAANYADMGAPLIAYIDWAVAENQKPCSAYYQSLDTTKIASNGFSCGGLMAEGTAGDPRLTTWGLNSSGMFAANQAFYQDIHTPVLMVEGGAMDTAYENGQRDYDNISKLAFPVLWFSKNLGHGGDLFSMRGGDFTKINLAWLNWWLKGDETATGKGALVGGGCTYCSDAAWETKSANVP